MVMTGEPGEGWLASAPRGGGGERSGEGERRGVWEEITTVPVVMSAPWRGNATDADVAVSPCARSGEAAGRGIPPPSSCAAAAAGAIGANQAPPPLGAPAIIDDERRGDDRAVAPSVRTARRRVSAPLEGAVTVVDIV